MSGREAYRAVFWARWVVLALWLPGLVSPGFAQALSQTEFQRFTLPPDVIEADQFGASISLSGDRALVGRNNFELNSSPVHVYELDATETWVEVAQLNVPEADRFDEFGDDIDFGYPVALSGDTALVGAVRSGEAGDLAGAVYVFELDELGVWEVVARLTASDAATADFFGWSLELEGERALIGAVGDGNSDSRKKVGSVYVFERDRTGAWIEVAKLTDSDTVDGDGFDISGVLSGNRALIAGRSNVSNGSLRSGSLHERDATGAWQQVATLIPSDLAADNQVLSFALSGDRALIGAEGNDDAGRRSGSVYVFERNEQGKWIELDKLNASDAEPLDRFGDSVALSGDLAIIGAPFDKDVGRNSGSVYVYRREDTGQWVEVNKLNASDGSRNDAFGTSVAFSDGRALIAAPSNSTGFGSVYVFNIPDVGDSDLDGIVDNLDNCPADLNPLQENFDGDLLGDVCDPDDDNDGVDDASDPYPLNPALPGEGGSPTLVLGSVDKNQYGFRFEGIDSHKESIELNFNASGSDLLLTLTGYDIDTRQEVRVRVNGVEVGFLSRTPNNGRGYSEHTIAKSLLNSNGNILRIEQLNSGWKWGVTDLLLSEIGGSGGLPILTMGNVDSGQYGFRFEGVDSNRVSLERQFVASGSDLTFSLTGYDIDNRREVRVLINGVEVGFLSRTPNRERGPSQLTIERNLLSSAGNTLRIEQLNPGWMWGVTDLLLSEGGT